MKTQQTIEKISYGKTLIFTVKFTYVDALEILKLLHKNPEMLLKNSNSLFESSQC